MKICCLNELENIAGRLFVDTVCPICNRILISTMPEAEMILVFGCIYCAYINDSMCLKFPKPTSDTNDIDNVRTEENGENNQNIVMHKID